VTLFTRFREIFGHILPTVLGTSVVYLIHFRWMTNNTSVYPKVSGLAAWSENCRCYSCLPLSAIACYFVSQSSEFCRHNPLCCGTKGKRIFCYRLSLETFGYTLVLCFLLLLQFSQTSLSGFVRLRITEQWIALDIWYDFLPGDRYIVTRPLSTQDNVTL